jgi:hypothetical protein
MICKIEEETENLIIYNSLGFDLVLYASIKKYCETNSIFSEICHGERKADSEMDFLDFPLLKLEVKANDIINLHVIGNNAKSHIKEISGMIRNRTGRIFLHDSQKSSDRIETRLLIILSYPLDSYKRREEYLQRSPDLKRYRLQFCYLGSYLNSTDWNYNYTKYPFQFFYAMQRNVEESIIRFRPHIVFIHHGELFYDSDGILVSLIPEMKEKFVDIRLAVDKYDVQKRFELTIDDEVCKLVKIIFPTSDWKENG